MGTNVIMPALGLAQETGRVLKWLKAQGERVMKGEPLIEIETDKATVEIEAPATGILARVTAAPGGVVPVGEVMAIILAPGEPEPAPVPAAARPAPAAPAPTGSPPAPPLGPAGTGPAPPHRMPASPKARRLAQERGVDLSSLSGSGPGGEILATDVLAAPAAVGPRTGKTAPLGTVWRLMAERTTQSWTTAPHFFLLREVNAGPLVAWRERFQERFDAEITYTDLLVKGVGIALREHPRLNGRWEEGTVVLNPEINIGVAVAVQDGLVVPVVHRADLVSLAEIAGRRRDLVARARAGKLRPADIRGGTFTISNLGMYGVDAFQAVINPPQAAILAVGRIAPRVMAVGGQPVVAPTMVLSLSCDHRVVDGAGGAKFLDTLVDLMEERLERLGEG